MILIIKEIGVKNYVTAFYAGLSIVLYYQDTKLSKVILKNKKLDTDCVEALLDNRIVSEELTCDKRVMLRGTLTILINKFLKENKNHELLKKNSSIEKLIYLILYDARYRSLLPYLKVKIHLAYNNKDKIELKDMSNFLSIINSNYYSANVCMPLKTYDRKLMENELSQYPLTKTSPNHMLYPLLTHRKVSIIDKKVIMTRLGKICVLLYTEPFSVLNLILTSFTIDITYNLVNTLEDNKVSVLFNFNKHKTLEAFPILVNSDYRNKIYTICPFCGHILQDNICVNLNCAERKRVYVKEFLTRMEMPLHKKYCSFENASISNIFFTAPKDLENDTLIALEEEFELSKAASLETIFYSLINMLEYTQKRSNNFIRNYSSIYEAILSILTDSDVINNLYKSVSAIFKYEKHTDKLHIKLLYHILEGSIMDDLVALEKMGFQVNRTDNNGESFDNTKIINKIKKLKKELLIKYAEQVHIRKY